MVVGQKADGPEHLRVCARRVFVIMPEGTPPEEIQFPGGVEGATAEDLEDKLLGEGDRVAISVQSVNSSGLGQATSKRSPSELAGDFAAVVNLYSEQKGTMRKARGL
ncbi:ATPase [Striga asiatica]|uniref:ATPase n=1 Tax=Striga asiatica TaxID=4170 RepID=A0A5A7QE59_STRAF|nr:ATPase [Striga asiatica]